MVDEVDRYLDLFEQPVEPFRPYNQGLPGTDDRTPGHKLYMRMRSHDRVADFPGSWGPVWERLSADAKVLWEHRAAHYAVWNMSPEPLTAAYFEIERPVQLVVALKSFWRRVLAFFGGNNGG